MISKREMEIVRVLINQMRARSSVEFAITPRPLVESPKPETGRRYKQYCERSHLSRKFITPR